MLAPKIHLDFGEELEALQGAGYRITASRYDADCFGNWFVDLVGPIKMRVVRERGQYYVAGPREPLEAYDLARAFDDREAFWRTLKAYAIRKPGDASV